MGSCLGLCFMRATPDRARFLALLCMCGRFLRGVRAPVRVGESSRV